MIKKSTGLAILFCLLAEVSVTGQDHTYNFTLQTIGGYTTPGVVPFWLRSNQFGSIPLDGASFSFIGAVRKDYDLSGDKLFDWGASFESRANLGQGSDLTLIEGYVKVRLGIFELRAGRSKKITGLCDTLLSSGSFSVSGNSLGIPNVEISIQEYYVIPKLAHLFAIKGNFSHGWLGRISMDRLGEEEVVQVSNYLHQKSFYGRFGKPSWSLKLHGGFNHQVFWCNGKDYYNDDYALSFAKTYLYVLTGKRYNNGSIQSERLGNHLGSIDIGLEYDFDKVQMFLYRQNFYDAGALVHLANIQDGLNGISFVNKNEKYRSTTWRKLLFEFLYSKNQAGEPWSPTTGSPYEGYYNHGQYIAGWSYLGTGLGSSFLSTKDDVRETLPTAPNESFINNRVMAFNFGCEGLVKRVNILLKVSWSMNYGTYWTTDEEQSTNIINPGQFGIFGEQQQFSGFLELNRQLKNGLSIGFLGAYDYGKLLYNSSGLFLKATYSFDL